jgi:cell shape-determining protein MreC
MTYLQDKRNRSNLFQKRLIILLVILMALFGMSQIKDFVAPTVYSLFKKSSNASNFLTKNSFWSYFTSKKNLVEENNSLKERLVISEQEKNKIEMIDIQNNEFRAALGSLPENSKKVLVTSNIKSDLYNSIIVNAGKDKNIQVAQLLLGSNGAMIGSVTEVYAENSKIQFIDDKAVSTPLLALDSNLNLEASGSTRGVLSAKLPRDSVIEIGEVVVLKSNPLVVVGEVAEIRGDERNPFKEVLVRLKDQYRYSQYIYVLQ